MRRVFLATIFVCYILSGWLQGKPMPNELWTILLMIAFYFFHRPPDQDQPT